MITQPIIQNSTLAFLWNASVNGTIVPNVNGPSDMGNHTTLSPLAKTLTAALFAIFFSWGLVGNGCVCHIILSQPPLSVTNMFLLNLSLADLLMTLFCGPIVMLSDFLLGYWPFGTLLCRIIPSLQGVSMSVSALTHLTIAIDRFVVVFRPLRPRIRPRAAFIVLISIWLTAIFFILPIPIVNKINTAPPPTNLSLCQEDWTIFLRSEEHNVLLRNNSGRNSNNNNNNNNTLSADDILQIRNRTMSLVYSLILLVFQYFLPQFVIISTYSAIAIRIWIQKTPGEIDEKRDQRIAKSKRKLLKMVILVAVLYGLSQLPRHVFFLVSLHYAEMWMESFAVYMLYVWLLCILAGLSATGYNPVIYCWMNSHFRRGFMRIFRHCCCCPCCCSTNSLVSTTPTADFTTNSGGGISRMESRRINQTERHHMTNTEKSDENVKASQNLTGSKAYQLLPSKTTNQFCYKYHGNNKNTNL